MEIFMRWVPLVEQELPTLSVHLSSPPVFSGVLVTWSLVLCVMFCRSLFVLLSIVLSVLLRYTDSDYPFGIFKLFLYCYGSLIVPILKSYCPRSYYVMALSTSICAITLVLVDWSFWILTQWSLALNKGRYWSGVL